MEEVIRGCGRSAAQGARSNLNRHCARVAAAAATPAASGGAAADTRAADEGDTGAVGPQGKHRRGAPCRLNNDGKLMYTTVKVSAKISKIQRPETQCLLRF